MVEIIEEAYKEKIKNAEGKVIFLNFENSQLGWVSSFRR